jgi:hypothetical protein
VSNTNRDATITKEMVEAYSRGDAGTLHRLLGLKPWETNPLDVTTARCPYPADTAGGQSWPAAAALRRELERLSEAT